MSEFIRSFSACMRNRNEGEWIGECVVDFLPQFTLSQRLDIERLWTDQWTEKWLCRVSASEYLGTMLEI